MPMFDQSTDDHNPSIYIRQIARQEIHHIANFPKSESCMVELGVQAIHASHQYKRSVQIDSLSKVSSCLVSYLEMGMSSPFLGRASDVHEGTLDIFFLAPLRTMELLSLERYRATVWTEGLKSVTVK